jgi:hypothetical protein
MWTSITHLNPLKKITHLNESRQGEKRGAAFIGQWGSFAELIQKKKASSKYTNVPQRGTFRFVLRKNILCLIKFIHITK